MEFSHPDIAIQARSSALRNFLRGLHTILRHDVFMVFQFLLCIPIIVAGAAFGLSTGQWVVVSFVTLLFLGAGLCRTAALIQLKHDGDKIDAFRRSRIKCMGNAMVTFTAGISLATYLIVFIPKISVLI